MPIRTNRFEMPRSVIRDEAMSSETYARFTAEPLEVGYGRTLGNSLRRVLLSSIEGAAITSVYIQGAHHEFCALDGVEEDVTDIILNLKGLLLKCFARDGVTLRLYKSGPGEVKAGDFKADASVQILNPDHHIATLASDGTLDMSVEVRIGRGFSHADWNKSEDMEIGRIPVDSVFSPVSRVNFTTENTRVGNRTDYDKLILEIWTDGRISPEEALTMSSSILRHHLDVFVAYDRNMVEYEETEGRIDEERDDLRRKLAMSVNEIELSVRAANCLNNANITTVGALAQKTEQDMLKYRNFGKKSLLEIKDKLVELGLSLGMTFDPLLLEGIESK